MHPNFTPKEGASFIIANAAASAAGVALPSDCDKLVLTNTSTTAIAFVRITYYTNANDVGSGTAATTTTDMPILPSQQIQRTVGKGMLKSIRAIASAADGNLIVTPGNGS